ncbi:MAG: hypothetical protein M1818_005559 [Claussenomyces sp. TS43310]|nr:MAG: hypothetical protein M1818_005559 [Claussenomyces sp. TS43310]
MLMNAEPRAVSRGFQTLNPAYRAQWSSPQGLVEMTDNEVNAWRAFGPGVPAPPPPPPPQQQQQQPDSGTWRDFNDDDENLVRAWEGGKPSREIWESRADPTLDPSTVRATYGSSFGGAPSHVHARAASGSRGHKSRRLQPVPYSSYGLENTYSSCEYRSMPLFNNHHEWPVEHETLNHSSHHASSYSNHPPRSVDYRSLGSMLTSSVGLSGLHATSSPCGSEFDSDQTSGTIYSTYSAAESIPSDSMTGSFTSLSMPDDLTEPWWPDTDQGNDIRSRDSHITFMDTDDLHHQYDAWQRDAASMLHYSPLSTISPKALSLNVPTTSVVPSSLNSRAVASTTIPSVDMTETCPAALSEAEGSAESTLRKNSHRRQGLPAQALNRPHVSILPSNDRGISKDKKRATVARNSNQGRHIESSAAAQDSHASKRSSPETQPRVLSKGLEPKPAPREAGHTWAAVVTETAEAKSSRERESKDDFLVRSKLAGMSYKDIRRQGGFTEAESTLRGRFRTLTKEKEERVRRPTWQENDIRLLTKAVRKLSQGADPSRVRVPWKQVADYIYNHGGSYHFGNATCRKRWDELQGCASS